VSCCWRGLCYETAILQQVAFAASQHLHFPNTTAHLARGRSCTEHCLRHMNTRRTTPPPLPPSKLEGRIRQVAELARDIKLLRLRGCMRDFCYHFVQAMQSVIKLNRVRSEGWRRRLCNQIQSNAASNSLKFNQTLPLSSILLSSQYLAPPDPSPIHGGLCDHTIICRLTTLATSFRRVWWRCAGNLPVKKGGGMCMSRVKGCYPLQLCGVCSTYRGS
jgi:hypothetical protein